MTLVATDTPDSAYIPVPFLVERVTRNLGDTFTLQLRRQGSHGAFLFEPGQFNMLYVFGIGEVPISISSDPRQTDRLQHTIRAVGNVTSALSKVKRGQVIGVRGPFGSAWPVKEAEGEDVVIVAGGIGLAPLRPAILHILANRARYGRFTILYGARTPKDILFDADLRRWSSRLDAFVDVTVDRAAGNWRGNVGVVTKLIRRAPFDPEHAIVMGCGPEVMMRYAVQTFEDRGLTHDRIFVSLERNMRCAVGFCGHCQFGSAFVCRDGPVFRFDRIAKNFHIREL